MHGDADVLVEGVFMAIPEDDAQKQRFSVETLFDVVQKVGA
ncbi:hypothetical protein GGI1_23891 [Acidithiobacillus sp. GGI-221]|nr:hypothetical protein GGI1_23891 [Acidithiobacillus sp. GGI-221]